MDLVFANLRLHDYFHLRNQPTIQDRCCTDDDASWRIFEGFRVRSARCADDNDRVRASRLYCVNYDRYKE